MREYTDGTLIKRGKYWVALVRWKDGNERGRLFRSTRIECAPQLDYEKHERDPVVPSGKGAKQAKEFLRKWRNDLIAAENAKRVTTETTVSQYLKIYIDTRAQSGSIEESTIKDYQGTAKNQLSKGGKHAIANVALSDLTPQMLREFEAWLVAPKPRGGGYSAVSAVKAHRLLTMALKQAVFDGLISSNPMAAVKPPKKRRSAPNALTARDVAMLNRELDAMELSPLIVAVKLAIYTGMRRGEVCGLRWQDVDLTNAQITVNRAVGEALSGHYLKDTKTDVVRTVPMPQALLSVLTEWRSQFEQTATELGLKSVERLFVLGDFLGNYRSPSTITKTWGDLAEELDLIGTEGRRVTFHDLRHTFATVAIAGGVDVKTVSSILGHANAAITLNVYASADPSAKRRAAAQIDALLG